MPFLLRYNQDGEIPPQLVPDHLGPDTHVAVATSLQHPFQWTASAPVAVEHALKHCTDNCCQLGQQRATTWQVCQTLAGQCTGDNKIILAHVGLACGRYCNPVA